VRLLPLALAALVAAPLADRIVRRSGANVAVGGGFLLVAGGLAALVFLDGGTPYVLVAGSLVALGAGAGVASTAASAAILGSVPPERAGGAAAVQETAFELGGALGVAVLGSVMTSAYQAGLGALPGLPAGAEAAVREGLPGAAEVAGGLGSGAGAALLEVARAAFVDGFGVTVGIAAGVMLVGAIAALALMPGRTGSPRDVVAARGAQIGA
jgi:DHA2 family multidrug resistance protein-like MFS transporter